MITEKKACARFSAQAYTESGMKGIYTMKMFVVKMFFMPDSV
jgi:hypothetical protein